MTTLQTTVSESHEKDSFLQDAAERELPVRALNTLRELQIPLTCDGIQSLTEDVLKTRRGCGAGTIKTLLDFQMKYSGLYSIARASTFPFSEDCLVPMWKMLELLEIPRVRRMFAELPQPITYGTLAQVNLDRETIGDITKSKIQSFIGQCRNGEIQPEPSLDEQMKSQALPAKFFTQLSNGMKAFFRKEKITTIGDLVALTPWQYGEKKSWNKKSLAQLASYREECLNGTFLEKYQLTVAANIEQFTNLLDFLIFVVQDVQRQCGINEEERVRNPKARRAVMQFRLGWLNATMPVSDTQRSLKTLSEVANNLGITGERVRQIAMGIRDCLCSLQEHPALKQCVEICEAILEDAKFVVESADFAEKFDEKMGWNGTTGCSLFNLLRDLGMSLEYYYDEEPSQCQYIIWMTEEMEEKYRNFAKYMKNTAILLEDKSWERMSKGWKITQTEYLFFLYRLLYVKKEVETKTELIHGLNDLYKTERNESNRYTKLLQEHILEVLEEVGPEGLRDADLIARCMNKYPEKEMSFKRWQSVRRRLLEMRKIIVFTRQGGEDARGAQSQYTLPEFFKNDKLRRVMEKAVREVRDYMEKTGLGVVCLWGFWEKYANEKCFGEFSIPFYCFRYLMEEFNSDDLHYSDTFAIHPDIMANDFAKNWLIYDYFTYFGKTEVNRREIMSFLCEKLKISSDAASRLLRQNSTSDNDGRSNSPYPITRPKGDPIQAFVNDNWKALGQSAKDIA